MRSRPARVDFDRDRLRTTLDLGLAQLELALDESTRERLLDYLALMHKWNAVYNLTAVRDPQQMLVTHLLDSLAVIRPLSELRPFRSVVDVGTGAGLPGIVLALVWPEVPVHLVEPVDKKASFLRQCKTELALTLVEVHAVRDIELKSSVLEQPLLIVCRAFASLSDYIRGIEHLVQPTTIVTAMKGRHPADEIAALPPGWSVAGETPVTVPGLNAERRLIVLAHDQTVANSLTPSASA